MSLLSNGRIPENDNTSRRDNVVAMPTLAERDRLRREKDIAEQKPSAERIVNMPPATLTMITIILGIHLLMTFVLTPEQAGWVMMTFGFVPENFHNGETGPALFASVFTHMALHGSWLHVAMNVLMLAAFGSGIERWLGSKRMILLFVVSGLFGAAAHYLLNTNSGFPMIGASGGLSGLFAAAIIMLNRGQREMGGRFGILPFALLWIAITVGFGMLGGPDGSMIAWAAHLGGFLGGFIALKAMRV